MVTIYNNYYDWVEDDEIKQELMDFMCVGEDKITDEMILDEKYALEQMYWDDVAFELGRFFEDGNAWLLTGTLGLWDGECKGGFIFKTFDEFCRCFKDCGYIKITDNKGHLEIQCSHHDGTNFYEVKRISDFGWEWYNNHGCYIYDEEKVHNKMWHNNFMTALPHFARDVYGCKE